MIKALKIIKFSFLKELSYPYEIIGFLIRKLVGLGFLILFWLILSESNKSIFNTTQIISYFLISQAVVDLTFTSEVRFGRDIQKLIKSGQITNYFIKPMSSVYLLFLSFIGEKLTVFSYSIITLILGIYLYGNINYESIVMFLLTLIPTIIIGLSVNVLIGIIGFYSPEAGSIQNMYNHVNKIFSGLLVPLDYFPSEIKNIAGYSFFPLLSYYPTIILQRGKFEQEYFNILGLGLIWAVALSLLAFVLWKKSVKNYEGIGI